MTRPATGWKTRILIKNYVISNNGAQRLQTGVVLPTPPRPEGDGQASLNVVNVRK